MLNKDLRGIDFAALDTLRLVYRRRSFTAAADELTIKQSSVSYTIDRLRKAFADPLFVRQGNAIAPTERCTDIVAAADRIIGEMELAALPAAFDPASVAASITISATYLSRATLLSPFIREVRQEAPGITIDLITGFTEAGQHLLSGRADFAMSPVTVDDSGLYGTFLFRDPYVCLMDPDNPLAQGVLTAERFAKAPHLVIHYGQTWQPPFHDVLRGQGLDLRIAVTTPNPEDVRHLIPGTDLVVAMPSHIARQFAANLYTCPCPVPSAAELSLYWPARLNTSPMHRWLRAKVVRLAEEVRNG